MESIKPCYLYARYTLLSHLGTTQYIVHVCRYIMYKTGILCAQFALVAVVIEVFIGVVVTATTDDGDDNVVGDDNYDVVVAVTVTSANDEDEKQDNIRSKIKSIYIM